MVVVAILAISSFFKLVELSARIDWMSSRVRGTKEPSSVVLIETTHSVWVITTLFEIPSCSVHRGCSRGYVSASNNEASDCWGRILRGGCKYEYDWPKQSEKKVDNLLSAKTIEETITIISPEVG